MSENKRYYWLKLKEGFFGDKEIKKLRKLAGGDTYTIIYLKLMLLSLRENGKLYFEGIEETFYEELALEINEEPDNVKFTFLFLQRMGLLEEISNVEAFLTQMPECVGSETEKAAIMRKSRARKKALGLQDSNNVTTALPPVAECYAEKEVRKEEEEKEKEKEIHSFIHSAKSGDNTDYESSVENYIETKIAEAGYDGKDADIYREQLKDNLRLKYMGGSLGQGIILMSDEQFSDLCDKLSLDEIEKYFGIVVECEKNGKRYKKKSHYQAILDMAMKDRKVGNQT